jgi:hypothetical protein
MQLIIEKLPGFIAEFTAYLIYFSLASGKKNLPFDSFLHEPVTLID